MAGAVLQALLAKSGKSLESLPRNTSVGKILRRYGVRDTPEFQRILSLPRRVWQTDPDLPELVALMTDWLRTPGGTMTLLPQQARALADIHDYNGMFGPIPVGEGKTIVSVLAGTVAEAKRPMLLLPAKLVDKTKRERDALAKHWRIPENLIVESVEMLGSPKAGPELLQKHLPDIVIADEAHAFKNRRAARTKRLLRYMDDTEFPDGSRPAFVPMAGTFLESRVEDFSHLMARAMPAHMYPLPHNFNELRDWGDAVDDGVTQRIAAGALEQLVPPGGRKDLSGIRQALGRRIIETPGVVCVPGSDVKCSLSIDADEFDDYTPAVDEAFGLFAKGTTPDGWELEDAIVAWMHKCQAALEYYSVWNPRPPKEWIRARSDWGKQCREILSNNRSEIDSEFQAAAAVSRGKYDDTYLKRWRAIKPTFTPNVEQVWFGDSYLNHMVRWLEKERGVVWVDHVPFGERLAKAAGVPYFGAGGLDGRGNNIETWPGGPIVASIAANQEGRNLQNRWARAYVTAPMGSSKEWEQLIGRFHRMGQRADTVEITVLLSCMAHVSCMYNACGKARMNTDMAQRRKLVLADWLIPDTTHFAGKIGPRWS